VENREKAGGKAGEKE